MVSLRIADRSIGPGKPCFIIAEAGVNHNGQLEMAIRLIDEAVSAGADAVKFQTFKAIRLATPDAPKAKYQQEMMGTKQSQLDMLRTLELSRENHLVLMEHCRRRGVHFLSTPFDEESADLLDELGVPAFKISSGEITNLPLLSHIAAKNKPLILSTGMCSLGEVETAVNTIEAVGSQGLILLHCVSSYPADPPEVNLRAMITLGAAFGTPVGYSDHTQGNEVAMAAVAMGACVVEKHFTLNRGLPGPDHRASLEPSELVDLIHGIRKVESALGTGRKTAVTSEADTAAIARKSLVAAKNIPAGTLITESMIAIRRPGTGLPPGMRCHLVNRTALREIPIGALFRWEDLT